MDPTPPPPPPSRPPRRTDPDPARIALADAVADELLTFVWHAARDLERSFGAVGLDPRRALLLRQLHGGEQHPKQLADALGTRPPALTPLLDELEVRTLLRRNPDPGDGRRTLVSLTGGGRRTLREVRAVWLERLRPRLADLDERDLWTLRRAARELVREEP